MAQAPLQIVLHGRESRPNSVFGTICLNETGPLLP
jgi:hypothetical protein